MHKARRGQVCGVDPSVDLAELRRVPGGSCAVAVIPKPLQERFGSPDRGYNTPGHAEMGDWLEHTGFNNVRRWRPRTGGAPWVVVANKP